MRKIRLIARLDIKSSNLVKPINLEGLRVVGEPNVFAKKYYKEGVDELIFMDCVATLYGRNNLSSIIKKATKDIFIPISTSGNSANVIDAIKSAKSLGIQTYGLTGGNGGKMKDFCETIIVPSNSTEKIQEVHIMIGHIYCGLIESIYFKKQS